jgi:Gpi18-like mannosyltransferase
MAAFTTFIAPMNRSLDLVYSAPAVSIPDSDVSLTCLAWATICTIVLSRGPCTSKGRALSMPMASDTDYMPIFQYMLWVYEKLAGTEKAVIDNLRYISCFVLLGDYIGVWYVYKWTDKKTAYFVMLLLCILNLGYSYNTILWGQIDGILCALIFMSVYYAYKGNNLLGAVCMVLAFNFKIQCIVIVPVWAC